MSTTLAIHQGQDLAVRLFIEDPDNDDTAELYVNDADESVGAYRTLTPMELRALAASCEVVATQLERDRSLR